MTRLSIVLFACAVRLVGQAQGPAPATDSAMLNGQVVARTDGRALAGVHLELLGEPGRPGPTTSSDSFGRFTLSGVLAEPRALVVRKAGFAVLRITMTPGTPAFVELDELAVLAGRILDETGEGIVDAPVTARGPGNDALASTATDDRGEYRLTVSPNTLLTIEVETAGAEAMSRPTTPGRVSLVAPRHVRYYPSEDSAERAEALTLRAGERRSGLDITVLTKDAVRQPFRGLEAVPTAVQAQMDADGMPGEAGVIRGRVTDTDGRALASALILLADERARGGIRMSRTDASGAFEFLRVPSGTFRVIASKPGYAAADGRPTVTERDANPAPVRLELRPWATIAGRVVNEFGEPVQGARVQVMATRYVQGHRVLAFAVSSDPVTDEQGAYRVYGLEPGDYVVVAELADVAASVSGFRRSYFTTDGTSDPTLVRIDSGQELNDLNVRLTRPRTYSVTGRVVDAAGQPGLAGGVVQMWPGRQAGTRLRMPTSTRVGPDGRFEFKTVDDGDYVLQAFRGAAGVNIEGEFGASWVSVRGSDVGEIVVTTSSGSRVAGSVVFETAEPGRMPSRAEVEIAMVPSDPDLAPANWGLAGVDPNWRFTFSGISGPRRIVATRVPAGWGLKTVRVNGVDVDDRPMPFGAANQSLEDVEVVLTDRPPGLGGRVTDARGAPATSTAVFLFSTESRHWYPFSPFLARTVTQADGAFSIRGVPSGTYYVAAAPASASSPAVPLGRGEAEWQQPDVLDALRAGALVVSLQEGQRSTVQLRR